MKMARRAVVCIAVLAASGAALAEEGDLRAELEALRARVEAQEAEIQQLRSAGSQSWLNERRTEEVKALVREVLSDAETRASLQGEGLTAGWRDGHFFLASEDGNFLLNVGGQIQTRYVYNRARTPLISNEDEDLDFDGSSLSIDRDENEADNSVAGFDTRRAKVRFDGHIFDPKLTYAVQINALFRRTQDLFFDNPDFDDNDREFARGLPDVGAPVSGSGGAVLLEDAWAAYEFADGWRVKAGQFKAPFLREELVNSKHQLATERSFSADLFTVDYTQGVGAIYSGEAAGLPVRVAGMFHDGSYAANTAFNDDRTDFAVAGRAELLLAGNWEQFDDFAAWSGDPLGVMVGAAIDYEKGERGHNPRVLVQEDDIEEALFIDNHDILKWTVDASVEAPEMFGFSGYAAVIGHHFDEHDSDRLIGGGDQYAYLLQGSVFAVPDKLDVFIRWEHLEMDGVILVNTPSQGGIDYALIEPFDSQIDLLTFGTNYYFQRHAAKATLDVVWALDPLPVNNTGGGLRADADEDQFSVRAQFQVLF